MAGLARAASSCLALAFGVAALAFACAWPAAAVERRVALVVGASAYVAVPHLPNTRADATEIVDALRRLGCGSSIPIAPNWRRRCDGWTNAAAARARR
jgi:hypothetical protein